MLDAIGATRVIFAFHGKHDLDIKKKKSVSVVDKLTDKRVKIWSTIVCCMIFCIAFQFYNHSPGAHVKSDIAKHDFFPFTSTFIFIWCGFSTTSGFRFWFTDQRTFNILGTTSSSRSLYVCFILWNWYKYFYVDFWQFS